MSWVDMNSLSLLRCCATSRANDGNERLLLYCPVKLNSKVRVLSFWRSEQVHSLHFNLKVDKQFFRWTWFIIQSMFINFYRRDCGILDIKRPPAVHIHIIFFGNFSLFWVLWFNLFWKFMGCAYPSLEFDNNSWYNKV